MITARFTSKWPCDFAWGFLDNFFSIWVKNWCKM